jgi:transposase
MAEALGGSVDIRLKAPAAWMPVSKVPMGNGSFTAFPHLLDRYKPGVIGVTRNGQRFTNESNSYHDVGAAMIEACAHQTETAMWLICDRRTMAKYGLGYAKPAPMPLAPLLRNGYLHSGRTLANWRVAPGSTLPGWNRPYVTTIARRGKAWIGSSAVAPPASTATSPTRRTCRTHAWRRLATGLTTPSK